MLGDLLASLHSLVSRGKDLEPFVFGIEQITLLVVLKFDLLLRREDQVVVVLHLAELGKDRHADVTVTLDTVDRECLCHFIFYIRDYCRIKELLVGFWGFGVLGFSGSSC